MPKFQLQADFAPAGDQEHAIAFLSSGVQNQQEHQVLLGITGPVRPLPWQMSFKTYNCPL